MTGTVTHDELDALLRELSDQIDVGIAQYREAERRYKGVSRWLAADESTLKKYSPDIYIQGSFALGTATKPVGDEGEFDLDVVCSLRATGISGTDRATSEQRKLLKQVVGDRLKAHKKYGPMVKPPEGRRRCWTVQYADDSKFHMDICPSLPEDPDILKAAGIKWDSGQHGQNYILVTDNQAWHRWFNGNPRDYRAWFAAQMRERLDESRSRLAMQKRARIEDIPEYEARTTLQRAIQILKRHRDIKYEGDDDAPISIIITTLAARAYDNDPNLFKALVTIINGMREHIRIEGGTHFVDNPVDSRENFADKWAESPRKAVVFFDWLDSLEAMCADLPAISSEPELMTSLHESFGGRDSRSATDRFLAGLSGSRREQFRLGKSQYALIALPPSPHALQPKWLQRTGDQSATIRCVTPRWNGFRKGMPIKSDQPLGKGLTLNFDISTTVREPYEVHWQVTNTGHEALTAGQLRGDFYPSDSTLGKRKRQETTRYSGRHWVKAFIVRNGRIQAESQPFIVNIR